MNTNNILNVEYLNQYNTMNVIGTMNQYKRDSTLKKNKDFTICWNSSPFSWLAENIELRKGVIIGVA